MKTISRIRLLLLGLLGLWLLPAAGCQSSNPEPLDGGSLDDGAVEDGEAGGGDLNGQVPDEALAAPTFSVQNRDGTERGRADLIGHPTVLWFYPKAATSG